MTTLDTFHARQLDQALALHSDDKIDDAITIYDTILASYYDHAPTLHAKGIALAQLAKYQEAQVILEQACNLEPDNATYLASLANAIRHQGQVDKALRLFKQSLAIYPSIATCINLGVLLYTQKDYTQAQRYYEQALTLQPKSVTAMFNLALCLLQNNKLLHAKNCLEKAVSLDAKHLAAWSQLGKLYMAEKAYRLAKNCYDHILQFDTDHAESYAQLALIYLQQDNDEKGLSLLEKAFTLQPDLEALDHNLACVYLHKRKYEKALKHWLRYLQQDPKATHYNIGVCYLYMGRYKEALDHFQHMLSVYPNHHATLVNLGACALQQNHRDQAIRYYQQAYDLQPQDEIAYLLAALTNKDEYASAPISYVTDLFNQYAHNYDSHLTNVLSYRVPHAIFQLVTRTINPRSKYLYTVDIGCGTGLCGELLSPVSRKLVGIDIADNMLDKAREKNIYDILIHKALPEGLHDFRDVDLIVAGDFFPYVGDLDAIFNAISHALRAGGHVAFTTEKSLSDGFELQENARFMHSFQYVSEVLLRNGFTLVAYENTQLRTHQRDYVEGLCYVASKC